MDKTFPMKYQGMSLRNMYGTAKYQTIIDSQRYVLSEKFFRGETHYRLPDGFLLEIRTYAEMENKGNYDVRKAFLQKCTLWHDGCIFYEYLSSNAHIAPFKEWVRHQNGHRYYPFHVDLYGISYLDLETRQAYNYIPEGWQHHAAYVLGESFLITDIHYNPAENLIAYGGCFWAGPGNVMVGDFSEPLHFSPKWIGMQELIDPDYDTYDELDFQEWSAAHLILKCGSLQTAYPIKELRKQLP